MTGTRYRLTLETAGDPTAPAYLFERRSFEREYGVSAAEHDDEFAPYAHQSVLVTVTEVLGDERDGAVADVVGDVVGVMRLVHPGTDPVTRPVKTLVDAALAPWALDVPRAVRASGIDVAHTWDVATLSVDRAIGRSRAAVLGALYHALVVIAERNDVRYLLMTVDERVRSTMRMVGLPTSALPGAVPMPFEGSRASTPAWGNCADMLMHQRRTNPEAHRLIRYGVGLTEVAMPSADAFTLDSIRAAEREGVLLPALQSEIVRSLVPLG